MVVIRNGDRSVWIRMGIVVDLEWGMGEDSEVG